MRNLTIAFLFFSVTMAGCARGDARGNALEIPAGTDVKLERKDGVTVEGRLVEVKPDKVVVETRAGRTEVPRSQIASVRAESPAAPQPVASTGTAAASRTPDTANPPKVDERAPEYRDVTVPAGTTLSLELQSAVGSDTSAVEDPVRATLRRPITADGVEVLPAGSAVLGTVTLAERSARVKGRARVAFRFTRIDPPGDAERVAIRTGSVTRVAEATKKQDAAKIGGGAVGGAIVGGILGGGDGAAKGAAVGGAAGTGVVLATRGKEVRLGPGTPVSVKLTAPVTVRVRLRR
jgi:hypothetical protein